MPYFSQKRRRKNNAIRVLFRSPSQTPSTRSTFPPDQTAAAAISGNPASLPRAAADPYRNRSTGTAVKPPCQAPLRRPRCNQSKIPPLVPHLGMATLRNLKIKTSTCKRIVKELRSYEKEVEKEAAKTADMKEKDADPYDLKQQENVLAESRMMVPDCHKRLEAALTDLKATLAELKESNEQGTEIGEAEATITEVEAVYTPTEAED